MTTSGGSKPSRDFGVFRRSLSRKHSQLTESSCRTCRSFIGASARPELLDLIEKLHYCILGPQFTGKQVPSL
jgi:hypothetical protein